MLFFSTRIYLQHIAGSVESDRSINIVCVRPSIRPSDQSVRCLHEESLGPWLSTERTTKTDQTGWMPRLIRVFAGRTGHFDGFVMLWLIYYILVCFTCVNDTDTLISMRFIS